MRSPGPTLQKLDTYQHSFFNADGTLHMVDALDAKSGVASCTSYTGTMKVRKSRLDVPKDSFAGASGLDDDGGEFCVAGFVKSGFMRSHARRDRKCLRSGQRFPIESEHWPHYPGDLFPPRHEARPGCVESFDCAVSTDDGRVVQSRRQLELRWRRVRPLFPRPSRADRASPAGRLRQSNSAFQISTLLPTGSGGRRSSGLHLIGEMSRIEPQIVHFTFAIGKFAEVSVEIGERRDGDILVLSPAGESTTIRARISNEAAGRVGSCSGSAGRFFRASSTFRAPACAR